MTQSDPTLVEAQNPVFILVEPQMGENIGAACRVMGNFVLPELRIVNPRDGWPNPKAETMATDSPVLKQARVFATLEEAIADCQTLYATTAQPRSMVKPVHTARAAMSEIRGHIQAGQRVGVLFGAEKSGLPNTAITISNAIITLPVDRNFSSLNLSMAVGVLAHEWRAGDPAPAEFKPLEDRASVAELQGLYAHLEDELDRAGFFYPPEKTPLMMQNLINIFARGGLTQQEVRTFRGVIKALAIGRGKARIERD
ncbi:RNA methyltransferase [Oceanicaulis alexandrii]|uniref:RNA methyltransferase n=1 Tax=Oceanicaulis alexandrii TaxID=153233 RepID=UPI002354D48E|nr:RNA methyltransferase [Oceanicaulis alexandrii]